MAAQDAQLTAIAIATDEFLNEIRVRKRDDATAVIREFADRYPNIRDNIEELFPALIGLERVAQDVEERQLRDCSASALPSFHDYEIESEIGRGGMGIVYQARQKSLDRVVAIKTLNLDPKVNSVFLQRFQREARIAAALHHSNIVPIYDVGCENGTHFIAMQFIDGINLADRCKSARRSAARSTVDANLEKHKPIGDVSTVNFRLKADEPTRIVADELQVPADPLSIPNGDDCQFELSEHSIARIGVQIADALDHIHGQGIIHRDIKPANIILDNAGKAWLADWGLVKEGFSDLTQTGELFGSLTYMAPERFKRIADARSDIYSLGATLYEMLTLHPLYAVDDPAELVGLIVNEPPRMPSQINSAISTDLETVVLKALDKRPEARYLTAGDFARDLQNFLEGRPVSARRLTAPQRFRRWCRANPAVAALTCVAFALLIIGITFSTFFGVSANRAKKLAVQRQQQSEQSLDIFFGTFFPEAGPDSNAVIDPAFSIAMDKAVGKIKASHEYDEIVVGKLLLKIGWIYFNQQRYANAIDVFQHAFDRVSAEHGETHEVAMMALDHVGMTLMRLEAYGQSEQVLSRAWQLRKANLGPEHEDTIHSLAKLGDVQNYSGRYDEAIRITSKVLNVRQQRWGPESQFALTSMNGLALAYIQKEQPEKAIELLEHVVEVKREKSEFNLGFAYNLHNLAQAHQIVGNVDSANQLINECLELRRQSLPETADSVISSRTLQAALARDAGEPETAAALLAEIWRDVSDTTPNAVKGRVQLQWGLCLKNLDRSDDAIDKLQNAHQLILLVRSKNDYYARLAQQALDELFAD